MQPKKISVIGLGHFGLNLSIKLSEAGAEVLAVDNRQDIVDNISEKVAHAVCMDATNERALKSLGLKEMDAVIVAIGEGFESSIITTALLQQMGIENIYNRIISPIHKRLLKAMNITNLLLPEADAADELAKKLILPGLLESFEITKEYSIFEIEAPKLFVGKTLEEIQLRKEYNLNLVTIRRLNEKKSLLGKSEKPIAEVTGIPTPDLVFKEGDILVLFGAEKHIKYLLDE